MSVRFPRQSIRVFSFVLAPNVERRTTFISVVLHLLQFRVRIESDRMDFIVFFDTNLDSHLGMTVHYNETVRDLKARIMTEHAATFPVIGELDVLAIKVEIDGKSYHLPDLMLVRKVFEGSTGDHFLHIDIAARVGNIRLPVTLPMIKGETKSAAHSGKSKKSNKNVSTTSTSGQVELQKFKPLKQRSVATSRFKQLQES